MQQKNDNVGSRLFDEYEEYVQKMRATTQQQQEAKKKAQQGNINELSTMIITWINDRIIGFPFHLLVIY